MFKRVLLINFQSSVNTQFLAQRYTTSILIMLLANAKMPKYFKSCNLTTYMLCERIFAALY